MCCNEVQEFQGKDQNKNLNPTACEFVQWKCKLFKQN